MSVVDSISIGLLYFLGVVPTLTALPDLIVGIKKLAVFGADMAANGDSDPVTDNFFRFMAGMWFLFGPITFLCLSDMTTYWLILEVVQFGFFVGGLARVRSGIMLGLPDKAFIRTFIQGAIFIDVVLCPLLMLWMYFKYGGEGPAGSDGGNSTLDWLSIGFLYFLGIVATLTGPRYLIKGMKGLQEFGSDAATNGPLDPVIDNSFRFIVGCWFSYGPMTFLCLHDMGRYWVVLELIHLGFVVGGFGRIAAGVSFGLTDQAFSRVFMQLCIAVEVVLCPLLMIWIYLTYGRTSVAVQVHGLHADPIVDAVLF